MIYLIGQLSVWLLLAAVFAALAGWTLAAERNAPRESALRRERDNLLRDVSRLAVGEGDASVEPERDDASRHLLEIRDGRIAELEHALENARARADASASDLAEAERRLERNESEGARALVSHQDAEEARTVDVDAEERISEEDIALQQWRLRYFEQRVRYLEDRSRPASEAEQALEPASPLADWRARDAEARAAYLADQLRTPTSTDAAPDPVAEGVGSPFAANADVDALLRWRLLYLERRVAHLQDQAGEAPAPVQPLAAIASGPDSDRWKWRARYLEARVRHLEQRPQPAAQMQPAMAAQSDEVTPAAERAPARRGVKPPVLGAARNGAPDDFTLIESVSALQQNTLNAIGVFHFDQIAAWTPENVAWIDRYFRLQGRIDDEEWVEQADDLAREGVGAARRIAADEDA